ncbi:hypothetical protein ACQ4WX_17305 [Streptomyces lasalocidi]
MRVEPGVFLLPVLVAVLRELPYALARLADPPRLRVTFGQPPARLPEAAADVLVVVPLGAVRRLHHQLRRPGHPALLAAVRRRRPGQPAGRLVLPPRGPRSPRSAEPGAPGLVQGPFIARDLRELGVPAPGRTAIVHTRPDGPLRVLDPIQPYGTRPPRPETYYSVDLTPHHARHTMSLPSSGKGTFTATAELSWHVADPIVFVRGGTADVAGLLLEHLRDAAARLTRGHPLRRAGAAQRAVNAQVGGWPVPGLAVSYTVRLVPEGAPAPAAEPSVPSRAGWRPSSPVPRVC